MGSGEHVWRYSYRLPRGPRVTLDSAVREVREDEEAWEVVTRYLPELLSMPARRLERMGSLRDLLASALAFGDRLQRLERELARLNSERGY